MSDYVCPPIGSIKKERVRRVRASISQPTPMPLARQLDRSFRCQFAASGFGANPTWIDGGRLELRAQVSLSTRRNGVPGNEHDAKSWGARPTDGGEEALSKLLPPLPPSLRQMAIVCLTHEASEAARHAQVATADAKRGTRVSIFGRSPAGGNRYPLSSSLAIADADGADGRGRRQREYQRSLCRNEMAF